MSGRQTPTVTVIVNCFNGAGFLAEAIRSVLAQSFQDWELVFWDNRSTDASAEVFQGFSDARLRYFLAPVHTVLYEARNFALEHARGQLVAFLDVDDWWHPDKLQEQVALFRDPAIGFAYTNYWVVNEQKSSQTLAFAPPLPQGRGVDPLLCNYAVGMLTLMVRRDLLQAAGFDPRFLIIGDMDLVARLACSTEYRALDRPLAYYRWHGANISATSDGRKADEMQLWLEKVRDIRPIADAPGLGVMKDMQRYRRGQAQVAAGQRLQALRTAWGIREIRLRIRMLLFIMIPKSLHGMLRA